MSPNPDSSARSRLILARVSGDVSTKAYRTQQRFVQRLAENLEDALASSGVSYHLQRDRFRFYIESESAFALDVLGRVFGIETFSPVQRVRWSGLEDLLAAGERRFAEQVRDRRFAVRARRGGATSHIPFDSMEIERELGRRLLPYAARVDLDHPEVTVRLEVRPETAYLYSRVLDAPAGLPLGVEGRALALVSGGFDSAVASWLMMKRGVALDYLFCCLGGPTHREGALKVMKLIADQWSYGYRPRLYEVDFDSEVRELKDRVTPKYWQVILKRRMFRVAERLAGDLRASALVTGEAVGQVSSQTLPNLASISHGIEVPILRPLVGFNKNEIVRLARRIGTYEFSASVHEYCALLPRHPATHASVGAIEVEEAKLDPGRIETLLDAAKVVDLRAMSADDLGGRDLEVDCIEDDWTVLDLRSASAYRTWHHPGALYLGFLDALKSYRSFDRNLTYVLYCEVGLKSAHLAEIMREAGFRCYHVKDGVKRLLRTAAELDLSAP